MTASISVWKFFAHAADDASFESEVWGDVDLMMPAFQRNGYQSVTVKLLDPTAFESFQEGGHGEGLLDCPQWTRPAEFRGWKAPEVLLNGNHGEIAKFRRSAAREKTAKLRPDLLE